MQGLLSDPRQATRAPGRPTTDRLAGPWRPRVHSAGRLAGAWRPADQGCVLRSALRHRQRRMTTAAHHSQHRHKALAQMHRTLTQVVSHSTGATGMAILTAMEAGERDPQRWRSCTTRTATTMRPIAPRRCKAPGAPSTAVPSSQAIALSDFSHQPVILCAQPITAPLATFADTSAGQPLPPKAHRHTRRNDPRFDARPPL